MTRWAHFKLGEIVANYLIQIRVIFFHIVAGIHPVVFTVGLFHDFPEARTGDHNYVNKRYVISDEERALADQVRDLPFAREIISLAIVRAPQKQRQDTSISRLKASRSHRIVAGRELACISRRVPGH